MNRVNLGHYVLGMEGMALLRTYMRPNNDKAEERVEEMRTFVNSPAQPPLTLQFDVPEVDVASGYASWSSTYDVFPNPLIAIEEPAVHALFDPLPVGVALDAACGTGRHSKYLHTRGYTVIGVDMTPEMLTRAKGTVPAAEFRQGDLLALPIESNSVDLAVCALALTHSPDLLPPMRELTRVVRPGGYVLISDFHPFMVLLGGTAFFVAADGSAGYVTTYWHQHSAYLHAFQQTGLIVERCVEPTFSENEVGIMSSGMMKMAREAFRAALVGVPGALVWLLRRAP
jgi:ubiquinone/menaquinone biosynthesis C-methylase UbiE